MFARARDTTGVGDGAWWVGVVERGREETWEGAEVCACAAAAAPVVWTIRERNRVAEAHARLARLREEDLNMVCIAEG